MKRLTALTLALLLALSLSACKKAEEAPRTPVPAAPADVETPREGFTTLTGDAFEPTNVKSISASAVVTEGRIPEGEYDLPEEVTRQSDLMISGGIALLAELPEEDIGFYGLEGKEFYPALIRWEDSLAEFDWLYMTPRCVEPRLWCFDFDGDGEEELVVDCYYASGTGVSMSDLHVVEKNADGTLTAYTFPADVLMPALGGYTCLVKAGNDDYVVLGGEMVHITELPGGEKMTVSGQSQPVAAADRGALVAEAPGGAPREVAAQRGGVLFRKRRDEAALVRIEFHDLALEVGRELFFAGGEDQQLALLFVAAHRDDGSGDEMDGRGIYPLRGPAADGGGAGKIRRQRFQKMFHDVACSQRFHAAGNAAGMDFRFPGD